MPAMETPHRSALGWADASGGPLVVLHEVGSPSHVRALVYGLNRTGSEAHFRELGTLRLGLRAARDRDPKKLSKQLTNAAFVASLPLRKPCRIILALRPYSAHMLWLLPALRRHTVYFHTSWPFWTGASCRFGTA